METGAGENSLIISSLYVLTNAVYSKHWRWFIVRSYKENKGLKWQWKPAELLVIGIMTKWDGFLFGFSFYCKTEMVISTWEHWLPCHIAQPGRAAHNADQIISIKENHCMTFLERGDKNSFYCSNVGKRLREEHRDFSSHTPQPGASINSREPAQDKPEW